MKPEEQRIALAKWAGWKAGGNGKEWGDGQTFGIPPNREDWHWQETPDYLKDLNSVNGLEKRLTDEQFREFDERLANTCEFILPSRRQRHVVSGATAKHRCEALLRTLGLWNESE